MSLAKCSSATIFARLTAGAMAEAKECATSRHSAGVGTDRLKFDGYRKSWSLFISWIVATSSLRFGTSGIERCSHLCRIVGRS